MLQPGRWRMSTAAMAKRSEWACCQLAVRQRGYRTASPVQETGDPSLVSAEAGRGFAPLARRAVPTLIAYSVQVVMGGRRASWANRRRSAWAVAWGRLA